jgi:hypothetical protein
MAGSGETGRSHRWIAVDLAISFGCSLAAVLAVITDQPLLAFVPVAGIGAILTIGRGHRESLLAVIREQRADVLGEAERMRMSPGWSPPPGTSGRQSARRPGPSPGPVARSWSNRTARGTW